MTTFNQRFVLVQCPTNKDEADRLSVQITDELGLKGWQLISTQYISKPGGGSALLLAFQK